MPEVPGEARRALYDPYEPLVEESRAPMTFSVGAAVEGSMSEEVFAQLRSGRLTNAANLTDGDQVASLCN